MGNYCFDSYDKKHNPSSFHLSLQDFKARYKFLKFPKNISFTHDPTIFRIQHRSTGEFYILKRITFTSEKDLSDFILHLNSIISFEHDHILKIYHYVMEKTSHGDDSVIFTFNLILENFHHTLQDELVYHSKTKQIFTELEVRSFLTSLVDALEFLQLKNISFGNLRPSNIYIDTNKKPKLMLTGEMKTPPSTERQSVDLPSLWYMSPQMRSQFGESFFPEKIVPTSATSGVTTIPITPLTGRPLCPPKSDVFSLGMIILEMMSMKGINGLNGTYCESIREYRLVQCQGSFGSSLLGLIESMLKENEMVRPDFMDLKRRMVMDEYRESTKSSRKPSGFPGFPNEEYSSVIEMKKMSNRLINESAEYYVESSEGDLSLLRGMSEGLGNREFSDEMDNENSPTRKYSDRYDQTTLRLYSGKKCKEGVDEKWLQGLEDEMIIENEKALQELLAKKMTALKKLVVNLGDNLITTDGYNNIRTVISQQECLKELIVSLPKSKLGDEGLDVICEGLSHIDTMSLCYLDFRKARISNVGLHNLRKGLCDQSNLNQLGMNLADNGLSLKGCQEIGEWFEDFGEMRSLALNLGGNKIGSEGLEAIGKKLVVLKDLEILMLFVYMNEIEGKEGLEAVFESVKQMKKLVKVKLDLSSNSLGDEEMEIIAKFIEESKINEIYIELKDNCVSGEGRKRVENKLAANKNAEVQF